MHADPRARVRVPQKNWFFLVDADDVRRLGVDALLDITRRDQAVPQSNAPDGYIMFRSLEFPTTARWASFGASILVTDRDADGAVNQLRRLQETAEATHP